MIDQWNDSSFVSYKSRLCGLLSRSEVLPVGKNTNRSGMNRLENEQAEKLFI